MKFLLDVEGSLKYTFVKEDNEVENILIDENVLIFDYDKGANYTTHLIYLKREGDLNFVTIKDGILTKSVIGKFDTKTNYYNQISILLVKSKINIIYCYSNVINSNIYTLHHVVFSNSIEEKYTIIRYVSKKKEISFTVDCDSSGNLHLFYNTVSNNFSYIYYTYFNPYSNRWLTNPIKLSNSDKYNEYPSIYVDSYDNIHGTWWEKKSNDFMLKYSRMSSVGKEKYKWNEINIPKIVQDKPESIITEDNNEIIINCNKYYLKSNDYGLNWIKEERNIVLDNYILGNLSSTTNLFNIEDAVSSNDIDNTDIDNTDVDNQENIILKQVQINQMSLELAISDIMDDLQNLKSRVSTLEDNTNNSKTGFRKFFS